MPTSPAKTKIKTDTDEREIVITRLIDAPRELVWEAWTDPERLIQWWGPKGFTNTFHKIELKAGGVWDFIMHGPDGVDYPNKVVFEEIVKPERIVYNHGAYEARGLEQFHVTVTFEKEEEKTKLTLRMVFISVEECEKQKKFGAIEGGNQTLERLSEYLAKQELIITRTFDAPREIVWKALSEAERLAQWWGPKGFAMGNCKVDFRPGGIFHYAMTPPGGQEMWGKFVYHDIIAPKKIIFISSFSDEKGGVTPNPFMSPWPLEVLNILTLEDHEGKTTINLRGGPINATEPERKAFQENRSSMQQGFKGTWEQLDAYLAKIKSVA